MITNEFKICKTSVGGIFFFYLFEGVQKKILEWCPHFLIFSFCFLPSKKNCRGPKRFGWGRVQKTFFLAGGREDQ